jgi:hypothetical protein
VAWRHGRARGRLRRHADIEGGDRAPEAGRREAAPEARGAKGSVAKGVASSTGAANNKAAHPPAAAGAPEPAGGPDPGEGPEPADAEPADGEHGAAPAHLVAATVCVWVEVANYNRLGL